MSPVVRGTQTPTERQACCTSPEQSKHDGPVPPQQYGIPTRAHANWTTAHDCAVGTGSRRAHARATSDDGGSERCGAEQPAEQAKREAHASAATTARIVPSSRNSLARVKFPTRLKLAWDVLA